MAAFIAKQMMGDQLKSVKAMGEEKDDENKDAEGDEDPEIAEARREAEEKRKEKHRKMEEERENMRQSIRDKYGIKKKEEPSLEDPMADPDMEGRLGRKKKTPAEFAAEAQAAEEEEERAPLTFNGAPGNIQGNLTDSFLPPSVTEFTSKVTELPGKIASEASEKCVVQ